MSEVDSTLIDIEASKTAKEPLLEPSFKGTQSTPDRQSSNSMRRKSSTGEDIIKPLRTYAEFFKKYALVFYGIFLLFSSVGNSIYFKLMSTAFTNYPYFLSQTTSIVYLPIFWGVVLYEHMYTNYITPDMWKFPKYKFFVMGAFDATAGLLMLFGSVYTAGSTQALIGQTVIPLTMILAYIILAERYKKLQYMGGFLILVGVIFVLVPKELSKQSDSQTKDKMTFNLLFLLSSVPQALSSIYKEAVFTVPMDINLLQAWVANWQVLFGFLLMPANSLSFLGSNQVKLDHIPSTLYNGFRCMLGINSIVSRCGDGFQKVCDDCEGAWIPLFVYLLFNIAYNVAVVLVIKFGGANLLYLIMTMRLPLLQLAFSLKFINNPPDAFTWSDGVGFAFILVGLIQYGWAGRRKAGENEQAIAYPSMFGFESAAVALEAKAHAERRMNPQRIRSGFYARLGISQSPNSQFIKESFKGSQRSSPGWKSDLEG